MNTNRKMLAAMMAALLVLVVVALSFGKMVVALGLALVLVYYGIMYLMRG